MSVAVRSVMRVDGRIEAAEEG